MSKQRSWTVVERYRQVMKSFPNSSSSAGFEIISQLVAFGGFWNYFTTRQLRRVLKTFPNSSPSEGFKIISQLVAFGGFWNHFPIRRLRRVLTSFPNLSSSAGFDIISQLIAFGEWCEIISQLVCEINSQLVAFYWFWNHFPIRRLRRVLKSFPNFSSSIIL